uniref:Cytochrome c oxidase subunit 7A2, mitochondrial n=1 Tax=Urocitellus parryii TaxID=9999 RepID=A0A8D2HV09_UROPR
MRQDAAESAVFSSDCPKDHQHCFTHFENNIPEKPKLFQEDNGIPAHLKGGVADALLYRATIILTVGGTGYAMYQLAMASFPKKQD